MLACGQRALAHVSYLESTRAKAQLNHDQTDQFYTGNLASFAPGLTTVRIDVSKERLDAFWHSQEEARSVANTAEGFEQLCAWIGKKDDVLIVFEAAGAYHRGR